MLQVFGKYFVQFSPFFGERKNNFLAHDALRSCCINQLVTEKKNKNQLFIFIWKKVNWRNKFISFPIVYFCYAALLFFIGRTEKQNSKECFKFYQSLQMINRTACSLVLHSGEEK
jgi:hypothetical protein